MVPILLVLQAVAGPDLPVPRRAPPDKPCPVARDGGEVVVCARAGDEFRMKRLPEHHAGTRRLPKAETTLIGNVGAAAAVEAASIGGAPSNRVMIRLKMPF